MTNKAFLNIFIRNIGVYVNLYSRAARQDEILLGLRSEEMYGGDQLMKKSASNKQQGQTLIETALILFLILLIVLGIAEFARAWHTKNSLKNAARHGARLAVVTPGLTDLSGSCPNAAILINAVCTSPGVRNDSRTTVVIDVVGKTGTASATAGDTIAVRISFNDANFFVVGGGNWPWPKALNTTEETRMSYE